MKHKGKNLDQKMMGPEPTEIRSRMDYLQALNWYNYHHDVPKAKKWLVQYCKLNGMSLKNTREINMTMCSIARMLNRDLDVPEESRDFLHEKINDKARRRAKKDAIEITHHFKFPLDDFEELLDKFYVGEYKYFEPDVYRMLAHAQARPSDAKSVADYYRVLAIDLEENDYAYLGKRKLGAYRKFVGAMVEQAITYSSNQRKPRKPRKKKSISVEKMVSKLKYKEIDNELQIKSISPEKIIGATLVYVYDAKYKKLSKIVSGDVPFTIKGTTIQNIDEEKSVSKILRKPKEFLAEFTSNGKLYKKRAFEELKTKESVATGRINEYKLILQAY